MRSDLDYAGLVLSKNIYKMKYLLHMAVSLFCYCIIGTIMIRLLGQIIITIENKNLESKL